MTVQQFFDAYDNKHKFTEDELKEIIRFGFEDDIDDDIHLIETIYGEPRRWSRMIEYYYEINGRYFKFYCDEGLTECQENMYDEQPEEVIPHKYEKTITVIDWEKI